jgi:hypothetical protein
MPEAPLHMVRHAVSVIEEVFAGLDAKVIDHRDCGEGLKIGINVGDAYEIADDATVHGALPRGTYLEVINGECLRLVRSER